MAHFTTTIALLGVYSRGKGLDFTENSATIIGLLHSTFNRGNNVCPVRVVPRPNPILISRSLLTRLFFRSIRVDPGEVYRTSLFPIALLIEATCDGAFFQSASGIENAIGAISRCALNFRKMIPSSRVVEVPEN